MINLDDPRIAQYVSRYITGPNAGERCLHLRIEFCNALMDLEIIPNDTELVNLYLMFCVGYDEGYFDAH